MFEGLDAINWEQFGEIHIAIGIKAHKIPLYIRNMLHEDESEREWAIACLLGEGQHLGMLSPATPHIIPYVLEVLADENYSHRGYLIMGLSLMFDHIFERPWFLELQQALDLEREIEIIYNESFAHMRFGLEVYDAIKQGYPFYKRSLNEPEQYIRLHSVYIMAYMQDDYEDALAALLTRIKVETDTEIRREIIKAIIKLVRDSFSRYSRQGQAYIETLADYLKESGSFDEQLFFARIMQHLKQRYFVFGSDLQTFIEQTLAKPEP